MKAKVGLTGDVMSHLGFVIQEREGRPFAESFAPSVRELCLEQDEMWGNLEGPVADCDDGLLTFYRARRSCYTWPKLFFPKHYVPALRDLNFRVLGIANNHSFDFETSSDTRVSRRVLREYGIEAPGLCFDPVVREVGGLSFAIFATTSFLNPPGGRRVALLTPRSLPVLLRRVRDWSRHVDFVVVMTHWGADYQPGPPSEIVRLARQLLSAGAHVIYGNHPHIMWPIEQPAPDKLVCYSLGNFTNAFGCSSRARDTYPYAKASYGGLLSVEFGKDLIRPTFYPLITRHNYGEWGRELGLRKGYWIWNAKDVDRWKSTMAKRTQRLFFRVERNGSPKQTPLTAQGIESFYPWTDGVGGPAPNTASGRRSPIGSNRSLVRGSTQDLQGGQKCRKNKDRKKRPSPAMRPV